MRMPSLCAGLLTLGAVFALEGAPPRPPRDLMTATFKRPAVRSTLAQAITDLGKLVDVKIVADWQGLLEAGVKPDTPVALPATESTLDKLLDQMLSAVATKGNPLACQAIGDSLVVTTQARALGKAVRLAEVGPATSRPADARAPAVQAVKTDVLVGGTRFKFENTPLSDVVEAIRRGSKLNIHVSYTALETSGIAQNTPVTMNASDVTAQKALDLLVEQLSGSKSKSDSVYWYLDEGVVEITTGTVLDGKMVTRTFDMGDLIMPVPDAAGPRMNLSMQGQGTGSGAGNSSNNSPFSGTTNQQTTVASATGAREGMQNKLIAMVQKSIGDDMWQPQGKGSITFLRNTMVVTQSRLGWILLDKARVLP